MPSVFLVSDTHFGHAGVCKFLRNDGVTKLRPWGLSRGNGRVHGQGLERTC
jgi:hypothetical protein